MVGEKIICPDCGSENPEGATFCMECGSKLEKVEKGKLGEIEYANLSQRFTAHVIDYFILSIILYIVGFAIIYITLGVSINQVFSYTEYTGGGALIALGILILVAFIIAFGYFVLLEGPGGRGQTVGKMLVSIRVVDENTIKPIGYGQSFARNILRIIDGLFIYLIGIILIYTSDKNQRLGDRAAGSIVIYER